MRVGVLGGTFDPIHYGHLVIAEEARVRLQLDRVIFVPAKTPPHKLQQRYSPAQHRLHMVQRAIASNPYFAVSDVELTRPGLSYTVDTLAILQQEFGPAAELYFLMGMDSLAGLLSWHRPADIIARAYLAVAVRPGYQVDLETLEGALPGVSERMRLLEIPAIGISSRELRQRVRAGLPIRYQLPDSVEAYIREHNLYVEEPGVVNPAEERATAHGA